MKDIIVKTHTKLKGKVKVHSYKRKFGLRKAYLYDKLFKRVKLNPYSTTRNYARLEKIHPVTAKFYLNELAKKRKIKKMIIGNRYTTWW